MFTICVNVLENDDINEHAEIGLYALYRCAIDSVESLYYTHNGWFKIIDNTYIDFFQYEDNLEFKIIDVYLKINGDIHCYSFAPENFVLNSDGQRKDKWNINIAKGKSRPRVAIQRVFTNKKTHTDHAYRHVLYDSRDYCCCIPTKKQISVKGTQERLYFDHERDREESIRNRNRPIVHNSSFCVII
jgi:hypothetical protein